MNESTNKALEGEAAKDFLKQFLADPLQINDNNVSYQLHLIVLELRKMNQIMKRNERKNSN